MHTSRMDSAYFSDCLRCLGMSTHLNVCPRGSVSAQGLYNPGPRDQSCTLHAGIPTPPIACFDKHIPAHCMLVYTLIYEQNNRVTYTCKKITFPQLHFWALNMWWILNTWARLYAKVWVWSHRWHVNLLWSDRWAQSICMSGQVSL